jgi:ABC-type sugar transport system substrate-binding protein
MKKLFLLLVIVSFSFTATAFAKGGKDAGTVAVAVDAKVLDSYPISGLGWNVTSNVKPKKRYTLAIVVKNNTNPWMNGNAAGFVAAGKAMGFEALVFSPAKNDNVEDQARVVDDLVNRKVDGIIVHPVDSNGIVPCVERAYDAEVPVIIEGTAVNTKKILGWYGTQYYDQGKVIAEYIAKALNYKGNIINLPGPPEAQNARERNQAIHEVFAKYPDIKIIEEQPSHFRRIDGMNVTENLLQKYKQSDIQAIIGSNDEAAMGALQAVEAKGYKAGLQNGGIMIAGFDCNEDASYAIREGRIDVSVNPDPPSLGWLGAAYLIMYLNDGTRPPDQYIPYPDLDKMESVIVDKTNIEYYIENIAWWKIPDSAR